MALATNLLSEQTAKMTQTIGGWSAVLNCTLAHSVHDSPFGLTLTSSTLQNGMSVHAIAGGDIELETEDFSVAPGTTYKGQAFIAQRYAARTIRLGFRFYDIDGTQLSEVYTFGDWYQPGYWFQQRAAFTAPENAVTAVLFIRGLALAADEWFSVSRPSVMTEGQYSEFTSYTTNYIPEFMKDDDRNHSGNPIANPLIRYLNVATYPLSLMHDTVVSWDYIRPVENATGLADLSSLTDPFQAEPEWLEWLAQTVGVSLDTIPSGGRSPWLAFETAGIDTWTEWEEDVDPLSIPGIPDTEWVDVETFSPDFFDTELARRLQIASGFNGILGGTTESIQTYVTALLNTESDDPFVYVVKHYATNPYRALVATLGIEDPDPDGDLLERAIESATPAGTNITTKHGVYVTARSYYATVDFFQNMWTALPSQSSRLPIRMIENGAANGLSLVTASVTGSTDPFYGGSVALARWYEGFSLYSGAVQLRTEPHSSFNLLGDISFRILVSNVSVPTAGKRLLASSTDKWNFYVTSTGALELEWQNSGVNNIVSNGVVNFGNDDTRPFWLRFDLDVDNGASGHDVAFYRANSLYAETWTQVGTTITTAGVSAIDSSANSDIRWLDNTTTSDAALAGIVYRSDLYSDIAGTTLVADINLTGEFDFAFDLINTGTGFFRLPTSNISVFVEPAAVGATNLVESDWVAHNQGGADDYWYFGHSPASFEAGTASLGDTLVVTGLPSDTYDWTVTLVGGTTVTGSTGTVTSITFDADTHGGQSILNITVRENTGQTVQALFSPDLLSGSTTVANDSYARTWTLTRAFTTAEYYEYSGFIDRDSIQVARGDSVFTSNLFFDAEEPITVGVVARRFWTSAGITDIVDHTFTGTATTGWHLRYNGANIEAIVYGDPGTVTLTYDETPAVGQFNLITLRRDVANGLISLWINDVKQDEAADPWVSAGLWDDVGNTGIFGDASAVNKFDFRYFGMFDRALSDDEIVYLANEQGRLVNLLPQAGQTINAPIILNPPTVYIPGFDIADWLITPALLDASPTFHSPVLGMFVVLGAPISAAPTLHQPQINMSVQMDALSVTPTFYQPTIPPP